MRLEVALSCLVFIGIEVTLVLCLFCAAGEFLMPLLDVLWTRSRMFILAFSLLVLGKIKLNCFEVTLVRISNILLFFTFLFFLFFYLL